MDIIDYIILGSALLVAILFIGTTLFSIVYPDYGSVSEWELDQQGCEQMRESGWSEEEIEEFMANCKGWYHPPDE